MVSVTLRHRDIDRYTDISRNRATHTWSKRTRGCSGKGTHHALYLHNNLINGSSGGMASRMPVNPKHMTRGRNISRPRDRYIGRETHT